jgi:hypothetical protein
MRLREKRSGVSKQDDGEDRKMARVFPKMTAGIRRWRLGKKDGRAGAGPNGWERKTAARDAKKVAGKPKKAVGNQKKRRGS